MPEWYGPKVTRGKKGSLEVSRSPHMVSVLTTRKFEWLGYFAARPESLRCTYLPLLHYIKFFTVA